LPAERRRLPSPCYVYLHDSIPCCSFIMASEDDRIARHVSKPGAGAAPKAGTSQSKLGAGAPKCPRCQKSVYANEKVIAIGRDYHIACLKCASCSKVRAVTSTGEGRFTAVTWPGSSLGQTLGSVHMV